MPASPRSSSVAGATTRTPGRPFSLFGSGRTFGRSATPGRLHRLTCVNSPGRKSTSMIVVNGALAALLAAILATETGTLAADHQNVALRCAAGLVVCGVTVLRARSRAWAAAIGLGTALAAEAAASLWHLPGEPGIAATLALFVLTGSALLALPVRPAAAVAVSA